jgi:hypothetical protein
MQGAPQQPRIDGYCAASGVRSSLALRWGWVVSLNLWGGVQPGLVYLPQIGLAAGGLTNNNNGYAGLICMQRVIGMSGDADAAVHGCVVHVRWKQPCVNENTLDVWTIVLVVSGGDWGKYERPLAGSR